MVTAPQTADRPAVAGAGPSLLIFDLDNPLVHSRIDFQSIRREIIGLLHRAGAADAPADALRRLSIPELVRLAEQHEQHAGPGYGLSLVSRCWEVILRHERAGMAQATIEVDTPRVLDRLRDLGYRLAVLTNNARPACLDVLQRFGLERFFELLVTRDDVAALKPDGEGVLLARQRLGVADGRAYLVGDSYIDGLAAQRGGAHFIAFRADPAELASRGIAPRLVIQHLSELLTGLA